jgi:hypothetical protein
MPKSFLKKFNCEGFRAPLCRLSTSLLLTIEWDWETESSLSEFKVSSCLKADSLLLARTRWMIKGFNGSAKATHKCTLALRSLKTFHRSHCHHNFAEFSQTRNFSQSTDSWNCLHQQQQLGMHIEVSQTSSVGNTENDLRRAPTLWHGAAIFLLGEQWVF